MNNFVRLSQVFEYVINQLPAADAIQILSRLDKVGPYTWGKSRIATIYHGPNGDVIQVTIKFFKLPFEEQVAVIAHECAHCFLGHTDHKSDKKLYWTEELAADLQAQAWNIPGTSEWLETSIQMDNTKLQTL